MILTAIRMELDAVLEVDAGAAWDIVPGTSSWDLDTSRVVTALEAIPAL